MYERDRDSTPNNLVTTEDDYAAVTIIPKTELASESKGGERLADTGVATSITFALGSSLLIAAIALEEMRGKVKLYGRVEDEDDV